jgi:hypothetical protein
MPQSVRQGAFSAVSRWFQRPGTVLLADSAIGGRRVVIALAVRRLFCDNADCARVTFAEQVKEPTVRYGRGTPALRRILEAVGVLLAGLPGARLASILSVPVSRTTMLSLVMALPDPEAGTPRVLGVDDFALKKVIWSRPKGVLHVEHERVRCPDLLGGGGYLPPSSTQILRRSHACSAGRVTDGTAGFVDGGR